MRAFETHGRALSAIASAWVGRVDVPDLLQEAARVAWQGRARFTPGSDLRAWLAQIIRHVGANWRRRQRPVTLVPVESAELVDPRGPAVSSPASGFDAESLGLPDDLARGLAGLSPTARECLLLHVVAGHTFIEIGEILGMSHNTAQSHARRARETLRASLGDAAPVAESSTSVKP